LNIRSERERARAFCCLIRPLVISVHSVEILPKLTLLNPVFPAPPWKFLFRFFSEF